MIINGGYENTSGGYDCECKLFAHMTPLERETRGLYLHEQRRRAGAARAAQPSATLARRKGFASTMERHPEMLHTLRHKIKSHHRHKGEQQGLTAGQYKKKRLEHLHELYSRLEQ